ncbi:MAG: type II toxin-antitoxin system HicB family antitoxin [Planctomycetes bacterium]|nr:type II toxin-antitoxin system HicB family antitoxin [Planctomycetota bacterium]
MQLLLKVAKCSDWGYSAWCPGLPGCVVWGDTRREAMDKARQAACAYIAHLDEALPRELERQFAAETVSAVRRHAHPCAQ